MLCRQLEYQLVAPPTIFISGTKSPLTKAFVLLAPFLDQTNTILVLSTHSLTHSLTHAILFFTLQNYATRTLKLKTHQNHEIAKPLTIDTYKSFLTMTVEVWPKV